MFHIYPWLGTSDLRSLQWCKMMGSIILRSSSPGVSLLFCSVLYLWIRYDIIQSYTVTVSTIHVKGRLSQLAYAMVEVKSGKGLGKGGSSGIHSSSKLRYRAVYELCICHLYQHGLMDRLREGFQIPVQSHMYPKRLVFGTKRPKLQFQVWYVLGV